MLHTKSICCQTRLDADTDNFTLLENSQLTFTLNKNTIVERKNGCLNSFSHCMNTALVPVHTHLIWINGTHFKSSNATHCLQNANTHMGVRKIQWPLVYKSGYSPCHESSHFQYLTWRFTIIFVHVRMTWYHMVLTSICDFRISSHHGLVSNFSFSVVKAID